MNDYEEFAEYYIDDDNIYQPSSYIVDRRDSILGIAERSTKFTISDAEAETIKKKKDKISEINNEIDRRKTAFEIV